MCGKTRHGNGKRETNTLETLYSSCQQKKALKALCHDNQLQDRIEKIGIFYKHDLTDVVENLKSHVTNNLGKQNLTQGKS